MNTGDSHLLGTHHVVLFMNMLTRLPWPKLDPLFPPCFVLLIL